MREPQEVTGDQALRALDTAPPGEAVAHVCAAALRAEPRDLDATLEHGHALSSVIRKKLHFARRGGRTVHGGDEFVAALEARGDAEVLRVFAAGTTVVDVALEPDTLQYVASYLME